MPKYSLYTIVFTLTFFLLFQCNKKNDDKILTHEQIDSLYIQANNLFNKGDAERALIANKKNIDKAKKANYSKALSKIYLSIGNAYYELDKPNEGSHYLFLAEEYSNNDPELLARINIIKGFILFNALSFDEAEKKFKTSIKYAKKIENKETAAMIIDRAYINIGNINFQLEKYDSALMNYYKTYSSPDIVNKIGSCVNMAEIFVLTNKLDSAQKYLQIAENEAHKIPQTILKTKVDNGLMGVKGLYHIKTGEYEKAIKELKNNNTTTTLYSTEELISMAYAKQNNKDSALLYFERNIDKKLNSAAIKEKSSKASALIFNDEKIAMEKNYEQKRKVYLLLISLFSLSCILLVYTIYNRRKLTKQRTQLLESEKEKLKMEKEISELKQEQFQKQVLATSIQLEQKNKFLEELKENFKTNKEFNLNHYLKNEQIIDKDLNNIHDILKEVNPNFFKKLNEIRTSKLTNLDIKYAAYIYMNMDNSQIASLLKVEPKTVSVTKYRLKQKLNLPKDVDLETYIRILS